VGYVESSLLPDEQIVYKVTLHWKIFLPSWFIILIGIVLLIFQPVGGGVVIFIGLLIGLRTFIKHKTSEFAVTSKRVVMYLRQSRRLDL
jgi:hypothetical protein